MKGIFPIWMDLVYGLRSFRRTPGFTLVVLVTLALGIGATSAIFSIVDAVLLHPLPYPNAGRLVVVWDKPVRDAGAPAMFDSYRDFQIFQKKSESFSYLAAATWANGGRILTGAGPARNVLAMPVGIDFFPMLGTRAQFGRTFQRDDLNRGCSVVLKNAFWQSAFGGQLSVIGQQIQLDQQPCSVLGVMPPGFTFYPEALSMWVLITPGSAIAKHPDNAHVGVFGMLKPGVSLMQAQKELRLLYQDEHKSPEPKTALAPVVYPLAEQFAYLTGPNLRLSVKILFGAISLVLLIACVNIANLLLGRSLVRQKELAVRAALGAGRWRIVRQMLTEGLLLSLAGAAIGLALAGAAVHAIHVLNPIALPPGSPVQVNLSVAGFTALLAVGTALLFGLIPALKGSRIDLVSALKSAGRSATFGPSARTSVRFLAAVEVMLSVALLAGAGLLIGSIRRMSSVPLGFRSDRLLTMEVELPAWSYSAPERRARFYEEALNRVQTQPEVASAAFATSLPLTNGRWRQSVVTVEGRPAPAEGSAIPNAGQASVTPDYFQAMGVPLRQGKLFTAGDLTARQPVAVINEALARMLFPDANPIGRRIKAGDSPWLTVVGVTGDEKDKSFFHEMSWDEIPMVFLPVSQDLPARATLIVRSRASGVALAEAVRKQLTAFEPDVPLGEAQTMDQLVSRNLAYPKFRAGLLGGFAVLSVLLASVGLYGVLAQSVMQRKQEFAVRMAVGAQRRDVLMMVVRQGFTILAGGLVAGLLLSFWLTRYLSSLLYGVSADDPRILAAACFLLVMVGLAASVIPALRAARFDAVGVLQNE